MQARRRPFLRTSLLAASPLHPLDLSNFVPGEPLWPSVGLDQNVTIHIGAADFKQTTNTIFGQVRGAQFQNGQLQATVGRGQPKTPK